MAAGDWVWDEWKRLTRFALSGRIALGRETRLWETVEIQNADSALIEVTTGASTYRVSVEHHKEAIADEGLECTLLLIYAWAITESSAADKLALPKVSDQGGVENWGEALLQTNGYDWNSVASSKANKSNLVEVSIVRNLLAHGDSVFTTSSENRFDGTGGSRTWSAGDPVSLSLAMVKEYRARLKSLLRFSGIRRP